MQQQSLEASGFEKCRKKTRKEIFLNPMNTILPWTELCKTIAPFYPRASKQGGRPVIGIELGKEPVPDETTLCKFRH